MWVYLSTTWRKCYPDTSHVVCLSVSHNFPYMVSISLGFPYQINLIILDTALLRAGNVATLFQGLSLWRHNDMVVIALQNTLGAQRDSQQRTGSADSWRSRAVNWLIICRISMRFIAYFDDINIYTIGRNRTAKGFGASHKYTGLRRWDALSSW